MKKFDWLPTECAPIKYPIKIIYGNFIFKNGKSIYIPNRKIIHNGWGKWGSTHIAGEQFKTIPVTMEITWFSYTEDKFYSETFDLPYEQISKLFNEGFISPTQGKKTTYKRIIVGLAPKGEISLWLGGNGIVVEVASFQAKEVNIDWSNVNDNPDISRKDYIRKVLERRFSKEHIAILEKSGVSQGLWKNTYRERYNWEPEITGISKPIYMWLDTFNGESEYFDFTKVNENTKINRAIPKGVKIAWLNSFGKKYVQEMFFDEQEIFKAFHKFHETHPNEKLKLEFEISSVSGSIKVFLKDKKYLLELKKK